MPNGRSKALALLLALVVIACTPGTIGKGRATTLAIAAASDSTIPVSVITAVTGTYGQFVPAQSQDQDQAGRHVWAVKLRGVFQLEGVFPLPGRTLDFKLVVLDQETGDILYTELLAN